MPKHLRQTSGSAERSAMRTSPRVLSVVSVSWRQRVGLGALVFFTVKGLAWLLVPAVLAWWAH